MPQVAVFSADPDDQYFWDEASVNRIEFNYLYFTLNAESARISKHYKVVRAL